MSTAQMRRWRTDAEACASRKLRLAQADRVRRDLRMDLICERLQDWVDAFRDAPPPPPPSAESLGAIIARRLELARLARAGVVGNA